MKKIARIFSTLILIGCAICTLVACTHSVDDIQYGSFYLVDNQDSYIVLTEETITFYNVDFSLVEEDIFYRLGESVNVSEILVGAQPYEVSIGNDKIFVDVYENFALNVYYNSAEKSLTTMEKKYILMEA